MPTTDVAFKTTTEREDEQLRGLKTVVAKTGLSRSTLYAYVSTGLFPKQRRLGVRRIAWLASDVRAWMDLPRFSGEPFALRFGWSGTLLRTRAD